jgi:FkbM family methyltransferase
MGEGTMRPEDLIPDGAPLPTPCAAEHPILLSLLTEALAEGDVFVDVGANVGFFALPMAHVVGDAGLVIAFEPAHDVAEELRVAARELGLDRRITVHEMALASEDGSMILRADPAHPHDSTKRSLVMAEGPVVADVPVRSFDGLVESGQLTLPRGISAIKIDVEGAEMHVLSGMRRTLERDRPRMIVIEMIESHLGRAGSTVADIHGFMRAFGYSAIDDARAGGALRLNAVFVPA